MYSRDPPESGSVNVWRYRIATLCSDGSCSQFGCGVGGQLELKSSQSLFAVALDQKIGRHNDSSAHEEGAKRDVKN
ncbi:MAG: hypothetical protein ACK4TA_17430 [Saprospiraceae bacterium]